MSHNSSTGTPLQQRSEYDLDEIECMEQLGTQPGQEYDSHEEDQLDRLRMSLSPKKKKKEMALDKKLDEEPEEPIDKFTDGMKEELNNYKSDLSRRTNIENLIAHLSTRYL